MYLTIKGVDLWTHNWAEKVTVIAMKLRDYPHGNIFSWICRKKPVHCGFLWRGCSKPGPMRVDAGRLLVAGCFSGGHLQKSDTLRGFLPGLVGFWAAACDKVTLMATSWALDLELLCRDHDYKHLSIRYPLANCQPATRQQCRFSLGHWVWFLGRCTVHWKLWCLSGCLNHFMYQQWWRTGAVHSTSPRTARDHRDTHSSIPDLAVGPVVFHHWLATSITSTIMSHA